MFRAYVQSIYWNFEAQNSQPSRDKRFDCKNMFRWQSLTHGMEMNDNEQLFRINYAILFRDHREFVRIEHVKIDLKADVLAWSHTDVESPCCYFCVCLKWNAKVQLKTLFRQLFSPCCWRKNDNFLIAPERFRVRCRKNFSFFNLSSKNRRDVNFRS